MMEVADPYEQYLSAVFESCDDYCQGSLSAAGLHQLCEKLQLQDHYGKLSKQLLGEYKTKRVHFKDFKDGLLELLDNGECDNKTDGELSPAREEPPKYVRKKYGRRSRAHIKENEEISSDDSCERQLKQSMSCSTDSGSSEESIPKKRRARGSRRKDRSLKDGSGKNESASDCQQMSSSPQAPSTNEVEHLVTAWSAVSEGVSQSLRREELVKVFQRVGLERGSEEAAQCVFDKLGLEENGRITLQELLEFIRSGGGWSKTGRSQHLDLESTQKNVSMDFIEPPSIGCVSGASLVEQWECAGVPGAPQLLQNLGFSPTQQIDLASLVTLLSDELKGLSEELKSSRRSLDPQLALLRANAVLQNLYIQSLKTTIEHVNAEKEKLRNDVVDANQRALLLAQEVDDHHSKLEHSTQQQVKVLEQKHAEKVRELTKQAKSEQDALLAQNMLLEKKLKILEEEENKNKTVISQLELENKVLEQEHRAVVDQLTGLQQTKKKLEKDLDNVCVLQQRVSEMEATLCENDVAALLERIQCLETENTNLRDRNDELSIEVEELSTKLNNTHIKKRNAGGGNVSADEAMDETIGCGGMKRRGGDSFVLLESGEESGGEEGSPRLGKVRKCSHSKDFAETTSSLKDLQIHGKSGNEKKGDEDEEEAIKTQDECHCNEVNSYKIMSFSEELEQAGKMTIDLPPLPENISEEKKSKLKKIVETLYKYDRNLIVELVTTIKEIIEEGKSKVTEALEKRCNELESSLELLKEEYEKTEDYWSEKLEEERGFFEEEQKVSDKKYSELLDKILEYEEMLNTEREQKQRLETIEERDSFEKQVADMEQECADLRKKLEESASEKEILTKKLQDEVDTLKKTRNSSDCGIQVSDVGSCDNLNTLSQGTEILPLAEDNEKRKTQTRKCVLVPQKEYSRKSGCRNCNELQNITETKLKYQRELDFLREEREKLFRDFTDKKHKLSNGRVYELEQKCHSLMVTLRHQQKQTEDILKNTWKQHKAEVKDLKSVLKMTEDKLKRQTKVIQEQLSKLAKTDLLVKDLFVENAYLISSVQKLEQQCQTRPTTDKTDKSCV